LFNEKHVEFVIYYHQ